jgi:hypothetical protein
MNFVFNIPVVWPFVIRALLPDMVKFAYIPSNSHRIQDGDRVASSSLRDVFDLPDNKFARGLRSSQSDDSHDEEHVLVMEFAENLASQAKK